MQTMSIQTLSKKTVSKRLKYIFAVLLSLAVLGGCREEMPSLGTASSNETTESTDASADVTTDAPAKEDKETSTVTSEKSENYKMAERTVLENHIKKAAEGDVLENPIFDDLDGDGSLELIAFCDKKSYNGDWWYTNGKKTSVIMEYGATYDASVIDTGVQKTLMLIEDHNIVKRAYLYSFKDGEVKELEASGQFGGIEKIGDNIFEVVAYAHDESFGSSERTEKKYWLYFEDGQFKEYVGEKITKADFMKYSGGKAALDSIEAEGGTVTEILRRANGIVNVNYTADNDGTVYNKYCTYNISGGDCKETASGDGIYLPSVLNPYSEEQLALHKLIIEASETDGEIVNPLFGDFDGDGINEVFAVFGKYDDDETYQIDGTRGEVWFASGDKAQKLSDHMGMGPWGRPYILKSSGRTFLNIWGTNPGPMGGTSHFAHNYLIKNSEISEIESYGGVTHCCGNFGDFGDYASYNEYWYYYLGDNFSEYYGKEITKEEFLKYDGAKALLDKITADGYEVHNILKRGNGLINVNYSPKSDKAQIDEGDYYYYYNIASDNTTLFYRNGRVIEKETNGGIYFSYLQYDEITDQTDFERFSEMIYDTAEGDENSFIRERFYGNIDGKNALYAYYGTDENFSLWYADKDGAKKVTEDISLFYADGDALMKKDGDYFVVKKGKSQKLDIMGAEDLTMLPDGSFTGIVKSGYSDSQKTEETKKPYWFRYRDGAFRECTGADITEEELLQYSGGRAFLDEVAARGGDLVNIVRRENGIININYALHNQTTTQRFFMTLEIDDDNKLTDITPKKEDGTPDNAGWYLHSLKISQ